MNTIVRNYLIEISRNRTNQTVTYQKLCDDCRLKLEMHDPSHRNQIAAILEEISIFEHTSNPQRPLLSALVIRLSDGYEGDGFYKLADRLGFGDWAKLKKEGIFEVVEINKCIEFWSNEAYYFKYK